MRKLYIHQLPEWPHFRWNNDALIALLENVRYRQGLLVGYMRTLNFNLRQEVVLDTLTSDVVKSSEIEGERLNAKQVRSSIARRLGRDSGTNRPINPNIEGIVGLTFDAVKHYIQPLTTTRLFGGWL